MASAAERCYLLQQCSNRPERSLSLLVIHIYLANLCDPKVLVACYEDDSIVQETAMDLLQGKIQPKGKLPVTVCPELKFGTGITSLSRIA